MYVQLLQIVRMSETKVCVLRLGREELLGEPSRQRLRRTSQLSCSFKTEWDDDVDVDVDDDVDHDVDDVASFLALDVVDIHRLSFQTGFIFSQPT